LHQPNNLTVVG